jgi:glyoxalase family protein
VNALVHGIHHVTCIAGDAQENVDFYTGVMGLRLIKRSVNQDSPDTYHLFFADSEGTPGTDLTFFPWPDKDAVSQGPGLATEVVFSIPPGSHAWWSRHLASHGVDASAVAPRFGERALLLHDPHGLALSLVETARPRSFAPWQHSVVPEASQLRGIDSVRMCVRDAAATGSLLTSVLGFTVQAAESEWTRYTLDADSSGTAVDVCELSGKRGRWGAGGVHHIAWRVADQAALLAARDAVAAAGRRPTPPIDRFWFTSVYFLEPGGVLFELATDGPGFVRDETSADLGSRLVLPPWLEPARIEIEDGLPVLRIDG